MTSTRSLFSNLPWVLACAALLAACGGKDDKTSATPGAAGQRAGGPPVAVTVVTLEARPIALQRELPGRVTPLVVAEVRPQVGGIVKKVAFTEGGRVEAGQVLYELDAATYAADVNSAQAQLARAQASLTSARAAAARADELIKIEAISKADHENAIAALRGAEADVGLQRATLERASVTAGYAKIVSPIAGRIGKSAVTQGALVTANQVAPLAVVNQLDPIYIDVSQSSSEYLDLRRALEAGKVASAHDVPVEVMLEDGSAYPHPGRLAFSEVTVDPMTGSYALRIVVPNPDNLLLPGMFVRALVSNAQRADGLLVPQPGITRNPRGEAIAMVVKPDNTVEQRTVQVSQTVGNQWLVEGGLAAGERVIVEGLQKIRPGAAVLPTERGAAQAAAPAAQPASATAR